MRIIEGIVSSIADTSVTADLADGGVEDHSLINIAPMGPLVDSAFSTLILRPFTTSTTYRNLKATGEGVFHVTDDALLIARGAIGKLTAIKESAEPAAIVESELESEPAGGPKSLCKVPVCNATKVRGVILANACRAYEFKVTSLDDSQDRTHIEAKVLHVETLREFLGFNRAKHAVLEAAILATRIHLTGTAPVLVEYDKLQITVDKTGDADEHTAMRELREFVESKQ